MDQITFYREAAKGVKLLELGPPVYVNNRLPANPSKWFQVGYGYVVKENELTRGYLQLALPDEKLYFNNLKKSISLTEEQMFRFFVGQCYPKYEKQIIAGIGQELWDALDPYRKIALLAYTWNCSFTFNDSKNTIEKLKNAIRIKDFKLAGQLLKPTTDGGRGISKSNVPEYTRSRRRAEAIAMENNTPIVFIREGSTIGKSASDTNTGGASGGSSTSNNTPEQPAEQKKSPCGVVEDTTSYYIDFDMSKYQNLPIWALIEINGTFEKKTFLHYFDNNEKK